ncbi:glycosyltransferase [Puniceicoccaceae bacterium K14]|nr:glycosyltransferase [Puniceicoccaceae bacterium K14]
MNQTPMKGYKRPIRISVFASIENPHFLSIFDVSDNLNKTETHCYYFNEMPQHRKALGWKTRKNSQLVSKNPISYFKAIHKAFRADHIFLLGIGASVPWLPLAGAIAVLLNKRLVIASEGLKKINTNPFLKLFLKPIYNRESIAFLAIGFKAHEDFQKLGMTRVQYYKFGFAEAAYNVINKHKQTSGNISVLSVGQLIERKNFQRILHSLSRYNGDKQIDYRIAGEGPLRESLQTQSKSLPPNIRLELLGNQSKECLDELFAEANIFTLPSEYDGWGVVVNQAVANGLPTLLSEGVRSGEGHLVKNGFNGYIFRNDSELDHAFHSLIDDSQKRNLLSRNCKEIWSKWNTQEIARRLCEFISDKRGSYNDGGPFSRIN